MKIELTGEEVDALGDLVFLGNFVVNTYREQDDKIEKYENLSKKIEKLHQQTMSGESKRLFKECNLWLYLCRLSQFLQDYDNVACISTVAEKLAALSHPIANENADIKTNLINHTNAKKIYYEELNKKGFSIIKIDILDMDDRMKKMHQEKSIK